MTDNDLKLCFCFECSPPDFSDRAYVAIPGRGLWCVHTCPIHGPVSVAELAAEPSDADEEE